MGLEAFKDQLNDLSWVNYPDLGWFEVEVPDPVIDLEAPIRENIAKELANTNWYVAADNTEMSKSERAAWINYRKQLRDIPLQPGFPDNVGWPQKPST